MQMDIKFELKPKQRPKLAGRDRYGTAHSPMLPESAKPGL